MPEVRAYSDHRGRRPFYLWLEELSLSAQRRILRIIARMEEGNLGDVRGVGEGVMERRVDFGPGYRVYFGLGRPQVDHSVGRRDKSTQRSDIDRAKGRWHEYRSR